MYRFSKGQNPANLDYASIIIDKAKFEEIAHADNVDCLVQTNQEPFKFEFSQTDLKLFKKFLTTCF
ncbi:MAG: hypothetical protein KA508_05170 [Gammaproteobacteria bacterium]|nr:hypothetical protein [Gammaproteobacteria bacterium]